jgi:hypothetical protein
MPLDEANMQPCKVRSPARHGDGDTEQCALLICVSCAQHDQVHKGHQESSDVERLALDLVSRAAHFAERHPQRMQDLLPIDGRFVEDGHCHRNGSDGEAQLQ